MIQSQLQLFIESNSIHLPINEGSKDLLKKWKPDLKIEADLPFCNSESKGLSRLRAMVIDQEEPEFCLSFYLENSLLHSTLYGNFPDHDVDYIPGIFNQRYPIICASVPGEPAIDFIPRVYFYTDTSDQFPVTNIIDVIGISLNSEFHVICQFPVQAPVFPPSSRDSILRGLDFSLGSRLTSELLFYMLISSIQERSTLVGNLPINLKDLTSCDILYCTLKSLIRTVKLDLSLSTLNNSSLTPVKDPETEKLSPSVLQMPGSTLLLIDETKMTQGPLTGKGIENLDVLMQLIHSQTLVYDFAFSKISFPTDIRVLVCSTGKTMLKVNTVVSVDKVNPYEFSEVDRKYIETCNKVKVALPDSVVKTAQEFFIQMRKEKKISPEDFHLILLLARLCAQSYLEEEVSIAHWENAVSLHSELSQIGKS